MTQESPPKLLWRVAMSIRGLGTDTADEAEYAAEQALKASGIAELTKAVRELLSYDAHPDVPLRVLDRVDLALIKIGGDA